MRGEDTLEISKFTRVNCDAQADKQRGSRELSCQNQDVITPSFSSKLQPAPSSSTGNLKLLTVKSEQSNLRASSGGFKM